MSRCFDCIFCSSIVSYPFADICDIDSHVIDNVYNDICDDFISNENADDIKEDFYTLLMRKRAEREERTIHNDHIS